MSGAGVRVAAHAAALVWRSARVQVGALVALTVVAGSVPALAAWLTKLVLDELVSGASVATLVWLAGALAATAIVLTAQSHAAQYLTAELSRAVTRQSQAGLFDALNGFHGLAKFEDPEFGDRLQLAQQAGRIAPTQLIGAGIGVLRGVVTLVGYIAVLVAIAPWMAVLVVLAAVPGMCAQVRISRRRADVTWRTTASMRREIFYGELLSQAHAAKEVRLFGLGEHFRARLLDELRGVQGEHRRLDRRTLLVQGALGVLGAAVAAVGLVWAIVDASRGLMTVGDVTVFVAALATAQSALGGLITDLSSGHHALLSYDHYHVVTTAPSDLVSGDAPAPRLRDGVELKDVWFRYGDDHPWVLRGIDLRIARGETVALVGVNGSGKSTLVKLLCRLHDPQKGALTWDGLDFRDLDVDDLRHRISTVFQDFMRYELTAGENIGLGRLDVTDRTAAVAAAADLALVHETLEALPKGYDTLLTRMFYDPRDKENPDRGVLLSGGQWQRVALSRAVLRDDCDLLVLDEPSSGLDAQAEHDIHRRLKAFRSDRSTVLISHRLSSLRDADRIVVLDDGEVSEQGTHDELMAADGTYATLFRLQADGYR